MQHFLSIKFNFFLLQKNQIEMALHFRQIYFRPIIYFIFRHCDYIIIVNILNIKKKTHVTATHVILVEMFRQNMYIYRPSGPFRNKPLLVGYSMLITKKNISRTWWGIKLSFRSIRYCWLVEWNTFRSRWSKCLDKMFDDGGDEVIKCFFIKYTICAKHSCTHLLVALFFYLARKKNFVFKLPLFCVEFRLNVNLLF